MFTILKIIRYFSFLNVSLPAQCPVYKKPQRTYVLLITPLWLQTIKSPDYWILRGVALLCDNK